MATPPIAVSADISQQPAPAPATNMEHGERYSFFLNDGTKSDGPKLYEQLIKSARSKIVIWDPYVNTDDIQLLSEISPNTAIVIITSSSAQKWGTQEANRYNSLRSLINSAAHTIP